MAPFPYQVRKSPRRSRARASRRALTAQPVYRFSPTAYDSSLAAARGFFADLERAERAGPRAHARGGRPRGRSLGPEETALSRRLLRSGVRCRRPGDPFPGRHALPRRGRRRRDPGRGQPDDHPAAGRHRAGRAARLDPHVRRPDGAGRGGGHQARGSGRPADAPAPRRRVLSADHRARSPAHYRAPRAAPRERGPDQVRRARGRADRRGRAQPVTEEARAKLVALRAGARAAGQSAATGARRASGALLYNALVLAASGC